MFKHIALATAFALTASAAAATNAFGHLDGLRDGGNSYNVPLVRAEAPGIVQIETLQGDVVGQARVRAGANSNVLVPLRGNRINNDVIAKLIVNGAVKDTARINVR